MNCKDNISFLEVLPDGMGSFQPCPALLTEDEAIRFLRLDTYEGAYPKNTLRNYRESGKLHATKIGRVNFYSRKELNNFINSLTQ